MTGIDHSAICVTHLVCLIIWKFAVPKDFFLMLLSSCNNKHVMPIVSEVCKKMCRYTCRELCFLKAKSPVYLSCPIYHVSWMLFLCSIFSFLGEFKQAG